MSEGAPNDGSSVWDRRLFRWAAIGGIIVTLITVIGLVFGGSDDDGGGHEPTTADPVVTDTGTNTTDGRTTATEPPPPSPVSVGLDKLQQQERVVFHVDANLLDPVFIAGDEYTDAVSGLVYPDADDGFDRLKIMTRGQFSSMAFNVGVNADATCSDAKATVQIQDETETPIWEPHVVGIRDVQKNQTIELPGNPVQVHLVQRALGTNDEDCDHGVADVAWGGVVFSGP